MKQLPFSLARRTALISGASSGLGAGFARVFAQAGANVVLGARRVERIEALAAEIGEKALAVAMDVTDQASIIAAFDAAEARFGTIHTIVCNAGVSGEGRSTQVDADAVRSVIDTNLLGVHLVAREGGKRLIASGSRERGDGRIILIGSITAMQNWTGDAAYAASKAAVAHLGKQFAKEWVRQGINVNTIQPGWIETEINDRLFATEAGDRFIAATNRKRLQTAESLHDIMLYLASDRSASVTGAVITVDDGQAL
jgi:NAD(P)-dependent dehydrogenase (short-subunit alcohol dehydrogenase family)